MLVSWGAQDGAGSGVAHYSVEVSDAGDGAGASQAEPEWRSLLLPSAIGLLTIALATWILGKINPLCRGQTTTLWIIQGLLALAASLPALLIGR